MDALANDLSPGDRAPSFKLATDGGVEISTAKLKGKPYVVYFYPKDDTSGCTKEEISFSEEKKEFDAIDVQIVGISKDGTESHKKFRKKHKLDIILASDPELEAANAFGVWVEKSMYGRKYMGIERATFLADGKGKIREIWRKVKVPGHVAAVLEAARKL